MADPSSSQSNTQAPSPENGPGTDRGPTEASLIEQLKHTSLFEGLGDEQLERVARLGEHQSVARGETIFQEGDRGDRVYLLLSGAVRISRQVPGMGEEAMAILRAGSAFGEMSLIDGSPRSADAIAHDHCELCIIRGDDLENLMFVDRTLACEVLWKVVRVLSARLRQTNDKMTFLSATGKFA